MKGVKVVGVETPFTSFYRLKECVHLYKKGIAYNGDVCSFPPILLLFPAVENENLWTGIFILLDFLIAFILYKIAVTHTAISTHSKSIKSKSTHSKSTKEEKEEKEEKELPKEQTVEPMGIAMAYLLNPYTILACAGKSLGIVTNVFVIGAIYMGLKKDINKSLLLISMASYLGLYPILLVPVLLIHFSNSRKKIDIIKGMVLFLGFSACLLILSSAQIHSNKWLETTYKVQILASDLTPNIGLWWYFFIQVFNTFRLFFVVVFQFLVVIFVMPISLKFRY